MSRCKMVVWLVVAAVFSGLGVFSFRARAAAPSKSSIDEWIGRRHEVLAVLEKSFTQPHPYLKSGIVEERVSEWFLEEPHLLGALRSTVQRGWRGTEVRHFQTTVLLDKDAIPKEGQGNSDRMAATVLMNHFFGPLEKLGYRTSGVGFFSCSAFQKTSNEWYRIKKIGQFTCADEGVEVEGEVIVSLNDGQALIVGRIRSRYIDE